MTEQQWQAIVACDEKYDSRFVYCVMTTRVFCRPSCKSKRPNRENVRVFASAQDALRGGFRPCKRCRPDLTNVSPPSRCLIDEATALLSHHYAEDLTLREISGRLFVSPFHLQRLFMKTLGISPSKYLTRQRIEAAMALLSGSRESITVVALSVGFKNPAHFASVFRRETGLRPTEYRLALAGQKTSPLPVDTTPHKSPSHRTPVASDPI